MLKPNSFIPDMVKHFNQFKLETYKNQNLQMVILDFDGGADFWVGTNKINWIFWENSFPNYFCIEKKNTLYHRIMNFFCIFNLKIWNVPIEVLLTNIYDFLIQWGNYIVFMVSFS